MDVATGTYILKCSDSLISVKSFNSVHVAADGEMLI